MLPVQLLGKSFLAFSWLLVVCHQSLVFLAYGYFTPILRLHVAFSLGVLKIPFLFGFLSLSKVFLFIRTLIILD